MASLSSALKETDKAGFYSSKERRFLQGTGKGRGGPWQGKDGGDRRRDQRMPLSTSH